MLLSRMAFTWCWGVLLCAGLRQLCPGHQHIPEPLCQVELVPLLPLLLPSLSCLPSSLSTLITSAALEFPGLLIAPWVSPRVLQMSFLILELIFWVLCALAKSCTYLNTFCVWLCRSRVLPSGSLVAGEGQHGLHLGSMHLSNTAPCFHGVRSRKHGPYPRGGDQDLPAE